MFAYYRIVTNVEHFQAEQMSWNRKKSEHTYFSYKKYNYFYCKSLCEEDNQRKWFLHVIQLCSHSIINWLKYARCVTLSKIDSRKLIYLPRFFWNFFFQRYVWPWAKKMTFAHDSFTCRAFSNTHPFPTSRLQGVGNYVGKISARICKRLRSPGIDSEELISPGWEMISEPEFLIILRAQESNPRNQFRQAV